MPKADRGGGGSLGGGLKSCLRDLQYVQPRFESFATPRRRYACLLRALALVLVVQAGDARRDSGTRDRCQGALKKMGDPKDVFVAGPAGDYGEACLEILRAFGVHDHDPAATRREIDDFTTGLRELFVEGYVVCSPDVSTLSGPRDRTLTQIAVEAVREPLAVAYGHQTWLLWSRPFHWSHGKGPLRSMQQVSRGVTGRLSAEVHKRDLHAAYRLFDLEAWAVLRRLPA